MHIEKKTLTALDVVVETISWLDVVLIVVVITGLTGQLKPGKNSSFCFRLLRSVPSELLFAAAQINFPKQLPIIAGLRHQKTITMLVTWSRGVRGRRTDQTADLLKK